MTTNHMQRPDLTIASFRIEEIAASTSPDWQHPFLEIFRPQPPLHKKQRGKLYLIPTQSEGEYDPDFAPEPTSAQDLPDLAQWTQRFVLNVVEIWAGRRSPTQLATQCHYRIFSELVRNSGSQKQVGHIRKIHIQEPLDGICEATVTVRYGDRLRAILVRFEGVDMRWLCTTLTLL